jgi:hypothetical protein
MSTTNPTTGADIVEQSATSVAAAGAGATGAAVPANAELTGGRAATSNPANATNGNLVAVMADKAGRIVTAPMHVRELIGVQQTAIGASTAETTIVSAGGAGVFNDLIGLIITTVNAAAATLTIRDATGGTTRMILNYPNAASAPSSPMVLMFETPIPQAVANNNWTAQASASATGINITALFAKNL